MRKSLLTLVVSLLLCGGAATAVIASSGSGQPGKPVQMAMLTSPATQIQTQAPRSDGGPPPPPARGRGPAGRGPAPAATPADRAARLARLCQDRYARAAGDLAYLEARLQLNPQQSTAFARWRDVRLGMARRQATDCAAPPAPAAPAAGQARPAPPSPVERMAREQTQLQQRLADIQAERPALESLYNTLTADQRQRFTLRAGLMGRGAMAHGPMMRGRMMMPGRRGPMGPGPMGRGPMGSGGPNRQAPPPPPQQP